MEQIVRPFQLFDPKATVRVNVIQDQVNVQPAHICWGTVGNLPTAVQQADNFNGINIRTVECDDQSVENTRQTENVRVENPNDSSQYVIVQRIRQIKLNKAHKKDYNASFLGGTLDIQFTDFFAGTGFGDVDPQNHCTDTIHYNR